MASHFSAPPLSADDLLVLRAVVRAGRFTAAARELGVNHTTVARRVAALERSLGAPVVLRAVDGWRLTPLGERAMTAANQVDAALASVREEDEVSEVAGVVRLSATDGFGGFVAAPAMAALRRRHPKVSLEIVATTRQASQHPVGGDLQVVVGRPQVRRAEAVHLAEYSLGLYASRDLLESFGTPERLEQLAGAPLVYFIESMLQVDVLDSARHQIPAMVDAVTSTNVFVHVEATRAGVGFGLLPCFLADRAPDLIRVLPEAIGHRLPYWLVARASAFDRPHIAAFLEAMRARLDDVRGALLGKGAS